MTKAVCWSAVLGCLAGASACGAVGDLTPIAMDRKTFQPRAGYARKIEPAPAGCGTVHPKAQVATFALSDGEVTVALDAAKADAKVLDLVRLDFTGRCRFADAPTLPLRRNMAPYLRRFSVSVPQGHYYGFGPATRKVTRGGRTFPVSVSGQYFVGTGSNKAQHVSLTLLTAMAGSCRFGRKVCGVRVADGNSNLRFNDALGLTQKDGQVLHASGSTALVADAIWLDTANDTFQKPAVQLRCGQLVRVGGEWYRLRVSADGSKITAKPAGVGTGKVVVPGDRWSVTLIGTDHLLQLSGGKEPVDVPAGRYVAANYEGSFDSGVANRPHRIRSGYYVMYGREKAKVFEVRPGEVTKVPVASPLTASVAVSSSKGTVRLNAVVRDASGARVSTLMGPKGRPPAPTVTVTNDKRQVIYRATLKYG